MDYKGLTDQQVEESRKKDGANILTPPQRVSLLKLFVEKFNDPIIRILIMAAILSLAISFAHGDFTETIGIILAIFLATGVGFWFEVDASRKFEALNTIGSQTLVRVYRNGAVVEIEKSEIVVDDIVLIETGEEIAADGYLLESTSLSVNESTLTGEPSIAKTTDSDHFNKDATYPSNFVLRGTTVLEGSGVVKVAVVGDKTEIGKVAKASTEESGEKTPLTIQLDNLAKMISVAGMGLAKLTFFVLLLTEFLNPESAYSMAQIWMITTSIVTLLLFGSKVWKATFSDAREMIFGGKEWAIERFSAWRWAAIGVVVFVASSAVAYFAYGITPCALSSWPNISQLGNLLGCFMIAVTMIVMAVPEGLPMSVTLSLALNMRRMLKSNNLVRKMHACETMGAINVICTDKTGTLTKNQMSVNESYFNDEDGDKALIFEGIALNSSSHLDFSDPEKVKTIGNPTESALLLWLNSKGVDYKALRESSEQQDRVPFSTLRKYMATEVKSEALGGKSVIYIKGAPEIVASMCGEGVPSSLTQTLLGCQNRAMRTLAFGYKLSEGSAPIEERVAQGKFIFLGFVAISDPVREDVPSAVARCLDAGVAIKVVTGDTPATAKEIARQIELWDDTKDSDLNHISGVGFEALSDEELLGRVQEIKIMSRARPSDKQRFVRLLQQTGGVVAVTGDGTNDAPALNFAHVGLSMGSGTSVAKEASDITLIDDSFTSIASAVMWGRSLYKNIQRFLLFQLTINVVAVTTLLLCAICGMESPLTITQMLWVNIIMDTFAAAALASLPPSMDVMKEKPRKQGAFIITKAMKNGILWGGLAQIAIFMTLLWFMPNLFPDKEYGLSVFFTTFVMVQFWNMFNAKTYSSSNSSAFKNLKGSMGFLTVVLLILAGQILIVSFGGKMFRVVPITLQDWAIIIGATSLILWSGELYRLIKRH